MSKSLLSHFTKEWRKWFDLFHGQIAFANKKGLICYFKKIYFPYAFDSFSQLSPYLPKSKSLPLLFTKEWPSPITKEQCGQFALFHEWMLFFSFADKWWAICTKNRWANSQPWFLNQNRRNLAFPHLYSESTSLEFSPQLKSQLT